MLRYGPSPDGQILWTNHSVVEQYTLVCKKEQCSKRNKW